LRVLHKTDFPFFFLFFVFIISWGCRPGSEKWGDSPPFKLSLAVSPAIYSGLVAIADEKGYFSESGLEVSQVLYPSGQEALGAVCRGEAQVATVADIALSSKIFEEPSIRILTSIASNVGSQIVAKRSTNLQEPVDLKGKRIGFSSKTVSEYFLYAFLLIENIPTRDIILVDIPPARQAEAIIKGDVDAISAFDTYAFEARKKLGEKVLCWDIQNKLAYHWLLAFKGSHTQSLEAFKRFIQALIKAEDYAIGHMEDAKRIIERKWDFDPTFLNDSWAKTRLNVSFNQSVITSMETFALWQMKKDGKSGEPPNILNYIDTRALDEVAPRLVTIFR
jgi:NitT/TauT family transport system substrate-binding protein